MKSPALTLAGDFNFLDICWKYNTAQRKPSRRFLECMEDSFLTQLVSEPTGGSPARPAGHEQRRTGRKCGGQELS